MTKCKISKIQQPLRFHEKTCLFFQLRGAQILDAVRLHKNGFPESLTYGEFWRRYRILSEDQANFGKKEPGHAEMKSAVEELLTEMDLDKSAFRLGNTQVSKIQRNLSFLEII